MKQFYLIQNDDGVRFVPSQILRSVFPCLVLGELSIDDDFDFTLSDLKKVNSVLRSVVNVEDLTSKEVLKRYGIKVCSK